MNKCTKCGKMYVHKPCPNCGNMDNCTWVIYDIHTGYNGILSSRGDWCSDVYKYFATAPVDRIALMLYASDSQEAMQIARWLQTSIREHSLGVSPHNAVNQPSKAGTVSVIPKPRGRGGRKSKIRLLLESNLGSAICVYMQQTLFHSEIRKYLVTPVEVKPQAVTFDVGYIERQMRGTIYRSSLGTITLNYDRKTTLEELCKTAVMSLNSAYVINEEYLSLDD